MIRVTKAGRGKDVILLHGLGANGSSFDGLVAALGGNVQTHAVDLPGFGQSHHISPGDPAMEGHTEAVLAYVDTFTGPVSLVGHSMGGRVALLVYERLQKVGRANALGLISPAIRGANLGFVIKLLESLQGMNDPTEKSKRVMTAVRHPNNPPDDATALKYRENFNQGRTWFEESGRALAEPLAYADDKLKGVKGDVVYIWGEDDRLVPLTTSDAITRLPKHAVLVRLRDCGHIPHEELPKLALPPLVDLLT